MRVLQSTMWRFDYIVVSSGVEPHVRSLTDHCGTRENLGSSFLVIGAGCDASRIACFGDRASSINVQVGLRRRATRTLRCIHDPVLTANLHRPFCDPSAMLDDVPPVLRQAKHGAILSCFEYWLRARDRSARPLPGRQHLDPVDMAGFLPYVALYDVVGEGIYKRFRARLIGTHFEEVLGRNVTGMYIDQTGWLENFDELYRRFSAVADEKVFEYGVSAAPARERQFMHYEHLTLPLAADGETIDMLFGVRCALPDSKGVRDGYSTASLVEPLSLIR